MKVDTRERALNSARELMLRKGKDGVRMQEIADHAKVNKGLLHYYFKSKENIFKEVFYAEVNRIFEGIGPILQGPGTMDEKLGAIIDRYFVILMDNPGLYNFVLAEMRRDPGLVSQMGEVNELVTSIELLDVEFRNNGIITNTSFAYQVLLNITSMCVFPFMMKPLLVKFHEVHGVDWVSAMQERREFLKRVVIASFQN